MYYSYTSSIGYISFCRPAYNPYENDLLMDVDDDEQIGIVVLGTNGLARELENKIKVFIFLSVYLLSSLWNSIG